MPMPAALARYHAGKTQVAPRRHTPVTKSSAFIKAQSRMKAIAKRAGNVAKEAEVELPVMTLLGAALPAVYMRYTNKPLPGIAGIDSRLVVGGALLGLSFALKGGTRRKVAALGAGCAAPALSIAITTGNVKVGEDDDDETAGDDDAEI